MIVVEVGHAMSMLLRFCHCQLCRCHFHFLGEKCGDEDFIYFCKINDWIQKYWVVLQSILKILSCFAPNLTHHFDDFFMWSGNHKFYIQFSRLLRLQSFRITLYDDIRQKCHVWHLQTFVWRAKQYFC
jgi:hypothetical protein